MNPFMIPIALDKTKLTAVFTAPEIALPIAIPALLKMPVTEFHTPEKKPPNRLKILVMPFHACWNMPVKKLPTVLNTFLMLDHAFVATDTIPFHMPVKKLPIA